jgi:hypothetical protein
MAAMTVRDEMNNVNRVCRLAGDDRRWVVLAALVTHPREESRYMVRDVAGLECQQVFLGEMHNLT